MCKRISFVPVALCLRALLPSSSLCSSLRPPELRACRLLTAIPKSFAEKNVAVESACGCSLSFHRANCRPPAVDPGMFDVYGRICLAARPAPGMVVRRCPVFNRCTRRPGQLCGDSRCISHHSRLLSLSNFSVYALPARSAWILSTDIGEERWILARRDAGLFFSYCRRNR